MERSTMKKRTAMGEERKISARQYRQIIKTRFPESVSESSLASVPRLPKRGINYRGKVTKIRRTELDASKELPC